MEADILVRLIVIAIALAGLGLLIFVHELGHFLAAKFSGVKVKEAALGFGPPIFKKARGETLYSIRVLPLGGFVKLAGMEPEEKIEPGEEDRAFDNQSTFKKIAIIAAGPIMNILFAIPVFASIFMIGIHEQTTVIASVMRGSTAEKANIKAGDRVVEIDGKKINKWEQISETIAPKADKKVDIVIERDGKFLEKTVTPKETTRKQFADNEEKEVKVGFLGVESKTRIKKFGIFESLVMGIKMTIGTTTTIVRIFAALFTGGIPATTIAEGSAGPVGIIYLSSEMVKRGIIDFLWFLGIISPNLAVVNLFPLPPLDGSRVVFLTYERIRGKKISKEMLMRFQAVGIAFLLFLMIVLTASDLNRIITNTFMKGF